MIKVAFSSRQAAVAALAGLVALTTVGCGSSGSSSGSGQLSVLMADAPPNLGGKVTAVNVTVTKVEVHSGTDTSTQSGSWKTVSQGAKSFNLLDLANQPDMTKLPHIVDSGLPAGHYNQLRLVVDPANCNIVVDGVQHPLVIPSGANTGLKALPFDIASQQDTVLLLDFDVAQSVNLQGDGTYKLQPVIRLSPVTLASVTGKIVDNTGAPMAAQVTLKDGAGVPVATSITSASVPPVDTDGVFAIHAIPSGTYTLEVAAQGYTTATAPVTLTAPNLTDAGTVTLTAGP
jgi:hypothetical protein